MTVVFDSRNKKTDSNLFIPNIHWFLINKDSNMSKRGKFPKNILMLHILMQSQSFKLSV